MQGGGYEQADEICIQRGYNRHCRRRGVLFYPFWHLQLVCSPGQADDYTPDAVFPIVWTILYLLMIIAFYRVLTKADAERQRRANQLFLGQLLLQVVWTYFFFTQGYIGLAFAVIILLDLIVYKMILNFKAADKAAAYMMYPYFWWLIYASFLNFSFTYINGMVVIF